MNKSNPDLSHKAEGDLSFFERFAEAASGFASRAPFFAGCIVLVVIWLVQGAVLIPARGLGYFLNPTYQLEINSATTIITFLLVALIQNSTKRTENAMNFKLNAMADALADFMEAAAEDASTPALRDEMCEDARQLREAVGVETRISA